MQNSLRTKDGRLRYPVRDRAAPDELLPTVARPRSKVTFDIESVGRGIAKLTATHGDFWPRSSVLRGISNGWPAVLASLKTLLETGAALP